MKDVKLKQSDIKKINTKLLKSLKDYRKTMQYMGGDAPIGILCLPKQLENILISNGYLRVYDLFNCDFTEIKGIGKTRIGYLTARLDQFITMG